MRGGKAAGEPEDREITIGIRAAGEGGGVVLKAEGLRGEAAEEDVGAVGEDEDCQCLAKVAAQCVHRDEITHV